MTRRKLKKLYIGESHGLALELMAAEWEKDHPPAGQPLNASLQARLAIEERWARVFPGKPFPKAK